MNGLAMMILATPLFGFTLAPPPADLGSLDLSEADVAMLSGPELGALPVPGLLEVAASVPDDTSAETPADVDPPRAATPVDVDDDGLTEEDRRYAADVRTRAELSPIHRAFGIATWGAMTITTILGFIQYYNLYGIGGPGRESTPCVTGDAVFGQDQCYGTPWPHLIAAMATTALYTVTFSLSLIMPDPNNVSEGPGEFAERVRIHEVLRWIHLVGMVAQTVLGFSVANGAFGDRANDFNTLEIVAGIHQAIGWTTWGALTAAAAVMIF
jgi:hypothetical protein